MRARVYIFLAVTPFVSACAGLNVRLPQDSREMQHQHENSYLHVYGDQIVAGGRQKIELHGINVGGWLVTEAWMCGFTDSKDTQEANGSAGIPGRSTRENLEDRFGREKAAALMTVWEDHWITARDLDQIRDSGFNLIRVPIGDRTLQHTDGSWILNGRGEIDFSRMDWIVREAALRGIYTIFDLHVWPEQRHAYEKIGRADGKEIREAMARLWAAIAAHYRGNGAIAAFDLINEFPGNWGVQQALSLAITKADPDRIQVVEGFTFPEFLKLYRAGQFPNSIFSEHLYGAKPLTTEEFISQLKETASSPVPVYIGEFLAADFSAATKAMNESKISWSSWTYKAVDMGDWSTFNYYSDVKTDIQKDSYQAIYDRWSTELTAWQSPDAPKNFSINENRLASPLPEPTAPLP